MNLNCMALHATARLVAKQQQFIRSSTALSTALLLATGLPAPVLAQTAARPQPAAQEAVEEVVVTGTRIVREGYEAPTPLSVIDSSALENRSDANLAILVAQMPAFAGTGGIAANTTSFSNATPGLNLLNLRSLGTSRTLVLVDGNRAVAASNTGQGVDIASIPSQLVSRVDIVTGGATVILAMSAGRRAAKSIAAWLRLNKTKWPITAQDADDDEVLALVVLLDLTGEFGEAGLDLGLGEEDRDEVVLDVGDVHGRDPM